MNTFKVVQDSGFPFVGYTFDDDGKMYCKTCGAGSKQEHSSVCPHVGHWPTRKRRVGAQDKTDAITRVSISRAMWYQTKPKERPELIRAMKELLMSCNAIPSANPSKEPI